MNQQVLPGFILEHHANPQEIIELECVPIPNYENWLRQQDEITIQWLMHNNFKIEKHSYCLIPNAFGAVAKVLVGCDDEMDLWSLSHLPEQLPVGYYKIASAGSVEWKMLALGWGLACYRYEVFKTIEKKLPLLVVSENNKLQEVQAYLQAIYLVRDLINTPAESMGPEELSLAAKNLGAHFAAEVNEIVGKDLIEKNYPAVYVVGRGSVRESRYIEIKWGNSTDPKLTLVGKGVCFDSGGLNLKPGNAMALMKKDMGGAAHALGLASLIMEQKLPVQLRVLIPAVENAISGSAYRPGDVIHTRKGLTVEVGNTDAEGRLILADALTDACADNPDLIIDFATLTGAARVAVGTQIPAMFSNQQPLATEIQAISQQEQDWVWQLPLYSAYEDLIKSDIADVSNNPSSGFGGAITAALFLQKFINKDIPWIHFDLMAYNENAQPGRPKGGEAMGLRTLFTFLQKRYQHV